MLMQAKDVRDFCLSIIFSSHIIVASQTVISWENIHIIVHMQATFALFNWFA